MAFSQEAAATTAAVAATLIAAFLYKQRRFVGEVAHIACSVVTASDTGEFVSTEKRVLASNRRPFVEAVAFRLVMGWGFYREGFLLSYVRSTEMQRCKTQCVKAVQARIQQALGETKFLYKHLDFSWVDFVKQHDLKSEGLNELVVEVTQAVIRKLLRLPENLDLMTVRDITAQVNDLQDALSSNPIKVILGLLHMRPLLASDSRMLRAQTYLRDFIDAADWEQESFCADVIAAGKDNGVDSRGCLAEILAGASYNTANVLSVLVWLAAHGKDVAVANGERRVVLDELKDLYRACDDLTSAELVNPHLPVAAEADAARKKIYAWINWTFLNFPNLRFVLRSDDATGKIKLMDLTEMNKLRGDLRLEEVMAHIDDHVSDPVGLTFSRGRFACPGQSLARTAAPLALRFLLAKGSPVHLGHKPEGRCVISHGGLASKLNVEWTSDGIPRSKTVKSLSERLLFSGTKSGGGRMYIGEEKKKSL